MSINGQIPQPFFGSVQNMSPQGQPLSPFPPNVPPPNFSIPPPPANMLPGGSFPRFSGPMYNQPTFNPMAMGCNTNVPPPIPAMSIPPPPYNLVNNSNNLNNNNNNSNSNRGGGHQGPRYNQRQIGQASRGGSSSSNNFNINTSQHIHSTNQQRQLPCIVDNIFNDAPKEAPCGFPYIKPTMPPPVPQNSTNLSPQAPMLHQQRGMGGRGFHQGNNGFHNNNVYNNNNNKNHNNANNNNTYNYNNRGRGGFRGGMGNRGGFNNNNKGRGGHNNNGHHDGNQKKKEPKLDKRDLPENNVFFCDTCDRGFKTEDKYKEHVDQHEKCRYKDCPFVAAPKVVQLHMNMQHRRGLADRIYSVKSEEDIKKWKEERRKNYPTADNVKKKKEKRDEKVARGEVIETKEFGKMKNKDRRPKRGRDGGRGRGGHDRHYNRFNGNSKEVIKVDDDDDDGPPEERKIERSRKEDDKEEVDLTGGDDSDNQDKESKTTEVKKIKVDLTKSPVTEGSKQEDTSLSLLSGYGSTSSWGDGSDDDDNDHADEQTAGEIVRKEVKHTMFSDDNDDDNGNKFGLIPKASGDSEDVVDDPSGGVEKAAKSDESSKVNVAVDNNSSSNVPATKTVKDGKPEGSGKVTSQRSEVSKRGHTTTGGPPDKKRKCPPKPPPKSYTLLEKLLAKEIRRERNKILQCVHFIVKNKFFDSSVDDAN